MELTTRPRFYLDVAEEVELDEQTPTLPCDGTRLSVKPSYSCNRHPYLGRKRPDLKPPGIRSWRMNHFRRWLIFHFVREDAIVLLRVRYGMMDLPSLEFQS